MTDRMLSEQPTGCVGMRNRAHKNVVVVALAAKLARIAWAVLAHGCDYDAQFEAAAAAA